MEAAVLMRSRRRCAVCFGLNRDAAIKRGQIAHLDHDASNSSEDNLMFICLDHHSEFDSRTSQSKNLMESELRRFRSELDEVIAQFVGQPVTFGDLHVSSSDPIAGRYVRTSGPDDSAEVLVERVAADRIRITGLALSGLARELGPNIGELEFEVPVVGDTASYSVTKNGASYYADIHFTGGGLFIRERYSGSSPYGMGAAFDGIYRRVA